MNTKRLGHEINEAKSALPLKSKSVHGEGAKDAETQARLFMGG